MSQAPTAIVLGGLAPGLAVTRSLGRRGVKVLVATHSPGEPAALSRYVAGVLLTPNPATNPDGFVAALLDGLPTGERGLIIPTEDIAVSVVARNHSQLSERFDVAGPVWSVAEWFIDKRKTAVLAEKVGVRAPRSWAPIDLDGAASTAENIEYPVLVKPSEGHIFIRKTGLKMLSAHDRTSLLEAVRVCVDAGVEPLLQEIIQGPPETGVNSIVYVRGGQVLADFTARKIRNWPVDWGSPCALISEHIDGLTERTVSLLETSGYEGMACAEYKFDSRCDDYQLMEVNVRHNLSGALAPRCGVDFPWIDYATHAGLDHVGSLKAHAFDDDVYWIDGFRDVANLASTGAWRTDARGSLAPYRGSGVRAFYDRDDMAPLRRRAARFGRKALARTGGRIRRARPGSR